MPRQLPTDSSIETEVPWADTLTEYDRAHLATYLRVLDALADNADQDEMARIILGIEPETEPIRARAAIESHIRRARWMTEHGHRHLLDGAATSHRSSPR